MFIKNCPDGGIGRRAGLKHQWGKTCAGSIPAPGTKNKSVQKQAVGLLFA